MATPRGRRKHWQWMLLVPFLGLVYPPLYARSGPRLISLPFVVWYQFALVVVGLLASALAFVAVEGMHRSDPASDPAEPAAPSVAPPTADT
ncbi:MAG: DUF3311 domain-containing protein [Actinomycetota bacterium]|nr:DUF3311 domain-containing protein [Actinomycetota bacterium]